MFDVKVKINPFTCFFFHDDWFVTIIIVNFMTQHQVIVILLSSTLVLVSWKLLYSVVTSSRVHEFKLFVVQVTHRYTQTIERPQFAQGK